MAAFAQLLADTRPARVITPVHPGFGGTPRPDSLTTIGGLADLYASLLDELDLRDVIVVGNSIGGWIAAELALRAAGRIGALALVDAAGIDVPGHQVADIFPLTPAELAKLSFYDPQAFRIDPASMTADQQRVQAANRAALAVYGGESMTDPGLRGRLAGLTGPVLVAWGEADQIVDLDYGRAYAAAIPGAQFRVLPQAGTCRSWRRPRRWRRRSGTWPKWRSRMAGRVGGDRERAPARLGPTIHSRQRR